jgi:hypothetical protein
MKSRNSVLTLALFFVVGALFGGLSGYFIGRELQRSDDQKVIAELRNQILDMQVDSLSFVLNKLAEESKSKHVKMAAKGFDTLAMIFREAANVKDLGKQHDILCGPSAKMAFMRTANLTQNADLTTLHKKVCELYDRWIFIIKDRPITAPSVLEINKVGQQMIKALIELDNTIVRDP